MTTSHLTRLTRGEMWEDKVSDYADDNDLTWDEAEEILRAEAEDATIDRYESMMEQRAESGW